MKQKDKLEPVVLAYGEVTGHRHAFYEPELVEYNAGQLKIKGLTSLQHEEHTKHTFEPGIGTVEIQREYTMGELRRSID